MRGIDEHEAGRSAVDSQARLELDVRPYDGPAVECPRSDVDGIDDRTHDSPHRRLTPRPQRRGQLLAQLGHVLLEMGDDVVQPRDLEPPLLRRAARDCELEAQRARLECGLLRLDPRQPQLALERRRPFVSVAS